MAAMKSRVFGPTTALLFACVLALVTSDTVIIECKPQSVDSAPGAAAHDQAVSHHTPSRFVCAADAKAIAFLNEFAVLDTLIGFSEELHAESHASHGDSTDETDELAKKSYGKMDLTVEDAHCSCEYFEKLPMLACVCDVTDLNAHTHQDEEHWEPEDETQESDVAANGRGLLDEADSPSMNGTDSEVETSGNSTISGKDHAITIVDDKSTLSVSATPEASATPEPSVSALSIKKIDVISESNATETSISTPSQLDVSIPVAIGSLAVLAAVAGVLIRMFWKGKAAARDLLPQLSPKKRSSSPSSTQSLPAIEDSSSSSNQNTAVSDGPVEVVRQDEDDGWSPGKDKQLLRRSFSALDIITEENHHLDAQSVRSKDSARRQPQDNCVEVLQQEGGSTPKSAFNSYENQEASTLLDSPHLQQLIPSRRASSKLTHRPSSRSSQSGSRTRSQPESPIGCLTPTRSCSVLSDSAAELAVLSCPVPFDEPLSEQKPVKIESAELQALMSLLVNTKALRPASQQQQQQLEGRPASAASAASSGTQVAPASTITKIVQFSDGKATADDDDNVTALATTAPPTQSTLSGKSDHASISTLLDAAIKWNSAKCNNQHTKALQALTKLTGSTVGSRSSGSRSDISGSQYTGTMASSSYSSAESSLPGASVFSSDTLSTCADYFNTRVSRQPAAPSLTTGELKGKSVLVHTKPQPVDECDTDSDVDVWGTIVTDASMQMNWNATATHSEAAQRKLFALTTGGSGGGVVTDACLTNQLDDLASTVVPDDSISNVGRVQPPPTPARYPKLPPGHGYAHTTGDDEHWDAVIDNRLPLPQVREHDPSMTAAEHSPYHPAMAQAALKLKSYNRGGYEMNNVMYYT